MSKEAISMERALKLALEALENAQANVGEWWPEAITALREALASKGEALASAAIEQPAPAPEVREQQELGFYGRAAARLSKRVKELEAQQQEPVEWMKPHPKCDSACLYQCTHGFSRFPECATSPPANANAGKPWVGLTMEDRYMAIRPLYNSDETAWLAVEHLNDEYEAIEAKLREKNT